MKFTMLEQFSAARRAGVPIIAIRCFDPEATIQSVTSLYKDLDEKDKKVPGLVMWDIIRGYTPRNKRGSDVMLELAKTINTTNLSDATQNPVEALEVAAKLPERSVLFMLNAQHHLSCDKAKPDFIQALWNLRDQFKFDKRSVVLLCSGTQFPPELQNDILVLDEALPDEAKLTDIINDIATGADIPVNEETMAKAIDALRGIAAFPAEQATAMSFTKDGLNIERLWERKRLMINDTPGLSVWKGGQKFDDLGGLSEIKDRFRRIIAGRKSPNVIIWVDEIEKAMSGSDSGGGDTSGTSQDQLGVLLSEMQDKEYDGAMLVGVPGAAKSAFSKAVANEAGVLTIKLDLGELKGQFVGQSEERIRHAMKVIEAVGGIGGAFFLATSNDIRVVKPELKRRFKKGIWFFDIPDRQERDKIWAIKLAQKPDVDGSDRVNVNDEGWTGAEIETCVYTAWEENISLSEAARSIIPVSVSGRKDVDRLQQEANGRYNSTTNPGPYLMGEGVEKLANTAEAPKRSVEIAD